MLRLKPLSQWRADTFFCISQHRTQQHHRSAKKLQRKMWPKVKSDLSEAGLRAAWNRCVGDVILSRAASHGAAHSLLYLHIHTQTSDTG